MNTFLEALVKYLPAFLTPLIAVIALYIAYQQKQIARQQARIAEHKLKHELYDKRLLVYAAVTDLVVAIPAQVKVDTEKLQQFHRQLMLSYFLFGLDVHEYLETVAGKARRLWAIEQTMKAAMNPSQSSGFDEERKELVLWFIDQDKAAKELFSKYLNLNF